MDIAAVLAFATLLGIVAGLGAYVFLYSKQQAAAAGRGAGGGGGGAAADTEDVVVRACRAVLLLFFLHTFAQAACVQSFIRSDHRRISLT